jgi:hypothetical protein
MHRALKNLGFTALLTFAAAPLSAGDTSLWRVQLDMNWLGPVELHMELDRDSGELRGRSLSGAVPLLQELPGEHEVSDGLLVFEAKRESENSFRGTIVAPWKEGTISFGFSDDRFEGTIEGGAFAGTISAVKVNGVNSIRDYNAILRDLDAVVSSKLFSPHDLHHPSYAEFRSLLGQIAAVATDDLDMLFGFHWAWQNDPFSHFEFKRSEQPAEQLFAFFDNYRVGFEAATVEIENGIAILKVRTMMGADTIEQIEAAYDRIEAADPAALIIDLRGNSGGAFAVKPLVEHVIDQPVDAGYFLSQVWNRTHERLPTTAEVLASPPWIGWSIAAFWKSVQESDIVRVRFNPAAPNFDGPVFVLLDGKSASATELAADAFRSSGVTTIIGQRTAGEMLSQSMFDVAGGFVVSLPVADYYSITNGRIEGVGVPVDVVAESTEALEIAKQLALQAIR